MQIWQQLFFFSLNYFRHRFFKKRYEGEASENLARSRHSEKAKGERRKAQVKSKIFLYPLSFILYPLQSLETCPKFFSLNRLASRRMAFSRLICFISFY